MVRSLAKDWEAEDIVMYSSNKNKISPLGSESLGSALLDCGCSSNVMGLAWWKGYKAGLSPKLQEKVREYDSKGKRFRFGGDEVLPSLKMVKFPAELAGKEVVFKSHVVNSSIPLLWSRPSMAKAGVVLDLPNDKAEILSTLVIMLKTSCPKTAGEQRKYYLHFLRILKIRRMY